MIQECLSSDQREELIVTFSKGIRRAERRLKAEGTDLYNWVYQPQTGCVELFQLFGCGCLVFREEIPLPNRVNQILCESDEEAKLIGLREIGELLLEGDKRRRPKKQPDKIGNTLTKYSQKKPSKRRPKSNLLFLLTVEEWSTYSDGCPECCADDFNPDWTIFRTYRKRGPLTQDTIV